MKELFCVSIWGGWGEAGREALICAAAGALGAIVNCVLDERPLVLPRLRGNRLELGFLGHLATCVVVAFIADGGFETAFLAALCGTVALRVFKQRVEKAFEEELAASRERRGKS